MARRTRVAAATDPTGVAQRLEPALTGNLDPVQPAVLVQICRRSGGDRAAATRLETNKPFLNGLVMFAHPNDLSRVVDAETNHSAFGIGECTVGAADGRGIPKSTLESVIEPWLASMRVRTSDSSMARFRDGRRCSTGTACALCKVYRVCANRCLVVRVAGQPDDLESTVIRCRDAKEPLGPRAPIRRVANASGSRR